MLHDRLCAAEEKGTAPLFTVIFAFVNRKLHKRFVKPKKLAGNAMQWVEVYIQYKRTGRFAMIRNIFIDLDNTILDFDRAERIALEKAFIDFGIAPTEELLARYHEHNERHWQMLERGEISRSHVLTGRFAALFAERNIACDPEAIQPAYERYLCIGHYFLLGAQALLDALYGKYRLYIASNGNLQVQKSRIESADLARYMDDIFISELIGFNKPSREFFERCFAQIPDFKRDETVMIGDSLTSDIRGGINAGIRTIWYNPLHRENKMDFAPDAEVDALGGIPALLEAW